VPVFFKGSRRVLFIHVPKAGGTSIEAFFEANGFKTAYLDRGGSPESLNPVRRSSPQHMPAALLQALFDPSKFDFVFMTVRHPMRRLASKFAMETMSGGTCEDFGPWLVRMLALVRQNRAAMDNHLRPQADFWLPEAHVFRMEDGFGAAFIDRLECGIGLAFTQRTMRRDMRATVSAPDYAQVDLRIQKDIRNYYDIDFLQFGYLSG
jgi:hypothetical protein